jgi:acetyltransferase-like isoleucine patch superfamily enzyme
MHVISPNARISKLADIEDSVRGTKIIIDDGVMIDAFVKVKVVGGMGDLHIGANSYINSGCVLYTGNGIQIGRDVLVAANCTFAPVNHEFRARDRKIVEQRFRQSRGGIVIGDDVWIGAQTVILDGAVIPDGAVIGACSLVRPGTLEPYAIYGGNPLQLLGRRE